MKQFTAQKILRLFSMSIFDEIDDKESSTLVKPTVWFDKLKTGVSRWSAMVNRKIRLTDVGVPTLLLCNNCEDMDGCKADATTTKNLENTGYLHFDTWTTMRGFMTVKIYGFRYFLTTHQ